MGCASARGSAHDCSTSLGVYFVQLDFALSVGRRDGDLSLLASLAFRFSTCIDSAGTGLFVSCVESNVPRWGDASNGTKPAGLVRRSYAAADFGVTLSSSFLISLSSCFRSNVWRVSF